VLCVWRCLELGNLCKWQLVGFRWLNLAALGARASEIWPRLNPRWGAVIRIDTVLPLSRRRSLSSKVMDITKRFWKLSDGCRHFSQEPEAIRRLLEIEIKPSLSSQFFTFIGLRHLLERPKTWLPRPLDRRPQFLLTFLLTYNVIPNRTNSQRVRHQTQKPQDRHRYDRNLHKMTPTSGYFHPVTFSPSGLYSG
jgi:hypothetical protein